MTVFAASGGSYSDYRIYALFATREAAQQFIDHPDSYADTIEEFEVYEDLPPRVVWYAIERYGRETYGSTKRSRTVTWAFDGCPYGGYRRKSHSFHRWDYGERAFGQDEAAVEKAWKEAHAAEEAAEAGL